MKENQTSWNMTKIGAMMRRFESNQAYLLSTQGCDALLVKGKNYWTMCKGSKVKRCSKKFLLGKEFVQDSRRIAEKFEMIKDLELTIRINFLTKAEAARFALGDLTAQGTLWKPVTESTSS